MFFVGQMRNISRRPVETFGHWGFLPWIVHYGLGRIVLRMLGHLWLGLVTKLTLSSTTVKTSQYPESRTLAVWPTAACSTAWLLHDCCMTAAGGVSPENWRHFPELWLLQSAGHRSTRQHTSPAVEGEYLGIYYIYSFTNTRLSMEMRAVSCVKRYTDRCVVL